MVEVLAGAVIVDDIVVAISSIKTSLDVNLFRAQPRFSYPEVPSPASV